MTEKTFENWMKQVDQELVKMCGMPSGMLEDYLYHDSFSAGDTPRDCAYCALEYNCESMGFDIEDIINQ